MAPKINGVKIIIFDLDDTLFDTYGQLIKPASRESCEAMINAGLNTSVVECVACREKLSKSPGRPDIYKSIVKWFGLREGATEDAVAQAGFQAFHDRDVKESIEVFHDTATALEELAKTFPLYLVTLGAPKTQRAKVKLLGLEPFFKKIYYVDVQTEKTKTSAFKEILKSHPELKPQEFLAVGNRIDSEISQGKALGMQTTLFLHGEYKHLEPQNPHEEPDFKINALTDLLGMLK